MVDFCLVVAFLAFMYIPYRKGGKTFCWNLGHLLGSDRCPLWRQMGKLGASSEEGASAGQMACCSRPLLTPRVPWVPPPVTMLGNCHVQECLCMKVYGHAYTQMFTAHK